MYLTKMMSPVEAIKSMLATEKPRLCVAVMCAALCAFLELVTWYSLFLATITMTTTQSIQPYLLVIVASVVGRYFLYSVSIWQAHLAAYHIIQKLRQFIIKAIANMPTEALQLFHRGDLEKRINDDCQALEPLIAHHTTDIVTAFLTPLLLSSLLFWIDWRLGLIALAPLPLALLVQFFMMRGFALRQAKYNQIVAHMHQAQLEFLRSIGVMKLFSVDSDSYQQLNRTMEKHHQLLGGYTKQIIGAWVTFITLVQSSLILVIPFAIARAFSGQLSITALAMVVILCAGILKPWLDLTHVFSQVQQSILAVDRLRPLFFNAPLSSTRQLSTLTELSCHQLSVVRGERALFNDVDLVLRPAQRVLIQGESGAGKSSFIATLSGAIKATRGGWFINGESIDELNDKERSCLIATVDQTPIFFSASLKENLTIADSSIDNHEIWALLTLVGLAGLVQSMPKQLDTDMGEAQRSFSGGEIQRFAIVRALLAKTPVLILDEATAHLDNLTEQKVLIALSDYAPQQIQIIISHRAYAAHISTHRYQLKQGHLSALPVLKGALNE